MKTVVCFGDSNTWGYDPESKERFAPDKRWPGPLAMLLTRKRTIPLIPPSALTSFPVVSPRRATSHQYWHEQ